MASAVPKNTGLPTPGPLVTATLEYDPNLNYSGLLTYEIYSAWILGPLAVANSIQVFLGGITLALSLVVWSEKRHRIDREGRVFLVAANIFNVAAVIIAVLGSFYRETTQARSWDDVWAYSDYEQAQPLAQGLVALVVQIFFARRSQRFLHGKRWIGFLLYPLIFANFGGSVLCTAAIIVYTNTSELAYTPALLLSALQIWLWTTVAADSVISLVLCVSLWRQKAGFGTRTGHLVNRVIRFSIGTALVTSVNATLAAVLYLIFKWDIRVDLFYVFVVPLPSIYVSTMLYALCGWGKDRASTKSRSDPESQGSGRFAKVFRTPRKAEQGSNDDDDDNEIDTAIVWNAAARRTALDHSQPLAHVSFRDVGGLALGQKPTHSDDEEARSIHEGGDCRYMPHHNDGKPASQYATGEGWTR